MLNVCYIWQKRAWNWMAKMGKVYLQVLRFREKLWALSFRAFNHFHVNSEAKNKKKQRRSFTIKKLREKIYFVHIGKVRCLVKRNEMAFYIFITHTHKKWR